MIIREYPMSDNRNRNSGEQPLPDRAPSSAPAVSSGSPWRRRIIIAALVTVLGTVACMAMREGMTETVYPEPGSSKYFYIQDYSGVWSEDAEKYIFNEAVRLNQATTAQVVVMSVPGTGSETLEGYSLRTANTLGIGSKEKNNGILILFTTDFPHVRMEVGMGLEGTIPDARAGRILDDYAVDAKNNRRWNEAAMNTFTAVAEAVYKDSGKETPESLHFVRDIPEGQQGSTFGDMKLPEGRAVTADEDFPTRLLNGFCGFLGLMMLFLPFYLVYRFFRNLFAGGGSYSGSDTVSGSSYRHSRRSGYSSRSSSSGSSHHGGGGGFRGGGASR